MSIGVIRIPKQERPTYAKTKVGKVEKEVVYYRLGSSTAIAKPEDIARMGKDSIPSRPTPVLALQFADYQNRIKLGNSIELNSVALGIAARLPDAYEEKKGFTAAITTYEVVNKDYWRELEEHIRVKELLSRPTGFVIHNQSNSLAENVRVEVIGSSTDGITVMSEDDLPDKPTYRGIRLPSIRPLWRQAPQTRVEHHGSNWTLTVNFGNVQPKSCIWASEPFYIGSADKDFLELEGSIYADNLPEPQKITLTIQFTVKKKPALTLDDLKNHLS